MHRVSGACKFASLSEAIHTARDHRQNATQYIYLHLFKTKFVAILLILTQKCHISQISNGQKVTHLEHPAVGRLIEQSRHVTGPNNTNKRLIFLKFDYLKYSNILHLYKTFEIDIGKGILAIDIYDFITAKTIYM